jgi:hypothetical protein
LVINILVTDANAWMDFKGIHMSKMGRGLEHHPHPAPPLEPPLEVDVKE